MFSLEDDLFSETLHLISIIKSNFRQHKKEIDKIKQKFDISHHEFILIRMISEFNNLQVSELAKKLNLTSSTISIRINGLVEKKMVERIRSDEDRRRVSIRLSEKGNDVSRLISPPLEMMLEINQMLDEKERELLTRILRKLNEKMDPENKIDPKEIFKKIMSV